MTEPQPQPDLDALMNKIENSPLGPLLRDEKKMNNMMYDLLAKSDDKVVVEMGRELKAGNISLQGLGEISAYRSVIEDGLGKVNDIDVASISQQLDEVIEQQKTDEAAAREQQYEDEHEDLFQGLWNNNRKEQ